MKKGQKMNVFGVKVHEGNNQRPLHISLRNSMETGFLGISWHLTKVREDVQRSQRQSEEKLRKLRAEQREVGLSHVRAGGSHALGVRSGWLRMKYAINGNDGCCAKSEFPPNMKERLTTSWSLLAHITWGTRFIFWSLGKNSHGKRSFVEKLKELPQRCPWTKHGRNWPVT